MSRGLKEKSRMIKDQSRGNADCRIVGAREILQISVAAAELASHDTWNVQPVIALLRLEERSGPDTAPP